MGNVIVFCKVIDCTTKDGKKFKAYETSDKNGNRINLRFIRDIDPPASSGYIELLDYWEDKRKIYKTVRVAGWIPVDIDKKPTIFDIEF